MSKCYKKMTTVLEKMEQEVQLHPPYQASIPCLKPIVKAFHFVVTDLQ